MREFTVGPNDAGQRLDRFVAKAVPLLPASLLQNHPDAVIYANSTAAAQPF